jgi:hypothetical integral membrane protein (TIGR02206 family)
VPGFVRFGPAHLALLAAVPAVAAALAAAVRARPGAARAVRFALAAAIAAVELARLAHALRLGWIDPPRGLPLELCDLAVWVAVVALLTARPRALELTWFLALGGSTLALLMPDLAVPLVSFPGLAFFASHGLVVATALFLAWTGAIRPARGAWARALAVVAGWAALVGAVDALYGTNYMYLRAKPAAGSLLDVLGPWPWYLVAGAAIAAALFFVLELPFRTSRSRAG